MVSVASENCRNELIFSGMIRKKGIHGVGATCALTAHAHANDLSSSSTPLFAHFGLCPPIEHYGGHMDLERAFALRRNM